MTAPASTIEHPASKVIIFFILPLIRSLIGRQSPQSYSINEAKIPLPASDVRHLKSDFRQAIGVGKAFPGSRAGVKGPKVRIKN
jgi:hypothetical protein